MSELFDRPPVHQCKKCKADIYFALSPAGKSVPINVQPVPEGLVLLTWNRRTKTLKCLFLGKGRSPELGRRRYHAHWVTCPYADEFRK